MFIVIHVSDKLLFSLLPTHGLLQHDSRLTSPLSPYMRFAMQVTQIRQLSFLPSAISSPQSFPHPKHLYRPKTNKVQGRVTIYFFYFFWENSFHCKIFTFKKWSFVLQSLFSPIQIFAEKLTRHVTRVKLSVSLERLSHVTLIYNLKCCLNLIESWFRWLAKSWALVK